MPSLTKNLIANFIGSIWVAVLGLLSIPVFIKYLGPESWGLVGFYSTLQVVFSVFDFGLGAALNREVAKLSVVQNSEVQLRNMVRTLEFIYFLVGALIGITIFAFSDIIVKYWISSGNALSTDKIKYAICCMGFLIGARWPQSLYSGGFIGLQRQIFYNWIWGVSETIKIVGCIIIMTFFTADIIYFFVWQLFIAFLTTAVFRIMLWKSLPYHASRPKFDLQSIKLIWRFAIGMTGISIISIVLSQADKIILIKILPLQIYGYYVFASSVASALSRVTSPVFQGFYPKMVQLVTVNERRSLSLLYHQGSQIMSILLVPATMMLVFFSKDLIYLWTHNRALADNSALITSILVVGTACNGLMNIPYALQLSHAWTNLTLSVNICAAVILIPLMFFLTQKYGSTGAAFIWTILNVSYMFVVINIMHLKILKAEKWQWYFKDIGIQVAVSLIVAALFKSILPDREPTVMTVFLIGLAFALSLFASILSSGEARPLVFNFLKRNARF